MNIRSLCLVATVLYACGTDIQVEIADTHPDVDSIELCQMDGRVYVDLVLREAANQPTSIALLVNSNEDNITTSGDGDAVIMPGPRGDGLQGLTASPIGTHHRIEWLTCSADETCEIPERITTMANNTQCACITDPDMFHVLQSITVIAQNTSGHTTTRAFDTLEVTSTCPVR